MSWSRRFRLRQSLKGSLWVIPLLGGLAGFVLAVFAAASEGPRDLPSFWQYSATTASASLAAIVGAVAALTGFVITVSVLAMQTAIGMFSARYMRLWYRDRMFKILLAVLIGTLVFSLRLLRSVGGPEVPDLGVTLAGFLVVVALVLFLIFFRPGRPPAAARCRRGARGGRRAAGIVEARADARRGVLPPGASPRSRPDGPRTTGRASSRRCTRKGSCAGPSRASACSCSRTRSAISSTPMRC